MAEEPNFPLQLSSLPAAQVLGSPSLIIRKFSSNFLLHKAICFSLVVALLSILPSQATTRSILATAWEILHLLFLGVAISYGLFSRRNADFDAVKETATAAALKADGAVSYFSNMFQVSSVFKEEDDGDGDDDEFYYLHGSVDETKSQAWNSQYQRNDPVVVVANESASRRPLFLPVRSLKSHLHDLDSAQEMENVEPLDSTNAQGEIFEMEMEEEVCSSKATRGFPPPPLPPLSPPSLDGLSNISKISSFRSSKKRAKPPPAPPPPPAFSCYGFPSTIEKKITKQSFKDELKDLSRRVRKSGHINTDIVFDLFESATKPGGSSVPRSCRTAGAKDVNGTLVEDAPKIDTEKAVIATPADSGKEEEEEEEEVKASVKVEKSSQFGGGDGNEVDKKADEFIAKFRKQITLQRLEAGRQAA